MSTEMTQTDALTHAIQARLAAPLTRDDGIDLHAELDAVLGDVGMTGADAGGTITFTGADPIADSRLALASAASLGLVAKSVALARLWRAMGGDGQDIAMDLRVAPRRLCPFYEGRWELANGYPAGNDFDVATALRHTSLYRCGDGRWVLPQAQYPKLRRTALKLLGVPDDREAVTAAVARWQSAELEEAGAAAGVVMPVVRSFAQFAAEEQYAHLAASPLIELERTGDADPVPLPAATDQPLTHVRALGLGHVIAGAGIGRTLALHGADVLNVWRPLEYESPAAYHSAQYGVRSSVVAYKHPKGRDQLHALLAGADVFYANRRPAMLDALGLTAEQLAESHPGTIHATVSPHGRSGPWAERPGFDQTAGSVAGLFVVEGDEETPQIPVITVVNDWIVPWLVTAGVAAALERRATEGGSWRVHVSLTRVALWILQLGIFDRGYVAQTAGAGAGEQHEYRAPELMHSDGPLGRYQGVTDQVRMSATPGAYRFGLLPMGAARPEWLDRTRTAT
ncbi:Formyl-CoA:oxalate CoA-transferase [Paraconexibacter sp. AEG42_29]|uniref:Formyl-CoA:oxalate CoA-transferase n=1 Tax=Paraconexibacter sp. AEG42_29 TaxID=2997339 RepID=A0AAU7APG4_9ACTN